MLNQITICGRLTAEPTLQVKNNNGEDLRFLRFTIACQRDYKSDDDYLADFIDCVAWRKTAEFIQTHFVKGQEVIVTGRLEAKSYTDKNSVKRKSTFVNVDRVYFAGAKKTNQASLINDEIPIPDEENAPPLETFIDEPESEL